MSEMAKNLKKRVDEATSSLEDAAKTGDDYLAEVRVGELEELGRVAQEHNIDIPGIEDTIAAHTGQIPIVEPKSEA